MTGMTTGMNGPLEDVLVVDLSRALAGPHAGMMLGDLGARVIKVEAPGSGDDTRGWGPPFVGAPGSVESTYFLSTNRNKESITLDLKDEADKDVLLRLVDRADVLVENFRTGVGTVVRTSLLAAVVGVHAFQGTRWTVAGEVGRAQGNHHPSIGPYGLFHCRDGSVQIAVGSEGLWRKLCDAFDLDPVAEGMATNRERVGNRQRVIEVIEAAFADRDAEPLLAELAAAGIPAGKVRSLDEVYGWDQALSQGLLVDVEHPTLGGLRLPGPPLRFFAGGDGEETTRRDHGAPPTLDQHGQSIRAWLADDA